MIKKKSFWAVIIISFLLAIAFIFSYFNNQQKQEFYKNHFLLNTFINGIDVSNLTLKEAQQKIIPTVKDTKFTIKFREDTSNIIYLNSIDYEITDKDEVKNIYNSQPDYFSSNGANFNYNVSLYPRFNETKLKEQIYSLNALSEEYMKHPKDAYINYDNGKFIAVPVYEGTWAYPDIVYNYSLKSLNNHILELDTTTCDDIYEELSSQVDVAKLMEEADYLNKLCSSRIIYELNKNEKILDDETTKKWIAYDSTGYHFNEDLWNQNLESFVENLAKEVNTVGIQRNFHSSLDGNISISGGSYGNILNKEQELEQLKKELQTGTKISRIPEYTQWEVSKENNGIGNTYIEINLTRQHLWYYINGDVVLESDIVSGSPTPNRKTPGGIYLIYDKKSPTVLIGEYINGKPEYETPVQFWMPFNGGIGLHDATWQSSFGGNRWLTNGSHGCINLPYDKAEQIYNLIDYNTPIICYYTN